MGSAGSATLGSGFSHPERVHRLYPECLAETEPSAESRGRKPAGPALKTGFHHSLHRFWAKKALTTGAQIGLDACLDILGIPDPPHPCRRVFCCRPVPTN